MAALHQVPRSKLALCGSGSQLEINLPRAAAAEAPETSLSKMFTLYIAN